MRRVACKSNKIIKQEVLDFLSKNSRYTQRFMMYIGRRCESSSIKDVAEEFKLSWRTVKDLEKEYMLEKWKRAPAISPRVIGIDEISIKKVIII